VSIYEIMRELHKMTSNATKMKRDFCRIKNQADNVKHHIAALTGDFNKVHRDINNIAHDLKDMKSALTHFQGGNEPSANLL
jgi:uncharacterized protein YoxC